MAAKRDFSEENEDAQLLMQVRQDFLEECQELLDNLSANLSELEKDPENPEVIEEIFRGAHTIKGSSSFADLKEITEVAHKMEDVLGAIKDRKILVTPEVIDLMYYCLQLLRDLRTQALSGKEGEIDISLAVEELSRVSKGGGGRKRKPPLKVAEKSLATGETESIRVKVERLDALMNLVSELITERNRLSELAEVLGHEQLKDASAHLSRSIGSLHNLVMNIRMVPIRELFQRFPEVVRNMARQKGKEVDFLIEGMETELDKGVIEHLYEPLVHLLRNAIDHGIEEKAEREKKGKPVKGQIRLLASRQQGNILIQVSDDGRGLDLKKIKKVAIEKGIVSAEEASLMGDTQVKELIFSPGFSTTKEVTDISGRGVGLDVVKERALRFRGTVGVHTERDKGTTFTLTLPLSLAVLPVLLVKGGEFIYSIPLNLVVETTVVKSSEIETMEKKELIFLRGEALPFKRLSQLLQNFPQKKSDLIPTVIMELPGRKIALAVDDFAKKEEVVAKPLGDYLGVVKGIQGASVLADGRVTLILDASIATDGNRG